MNVEHLSLLKQGVDVWNTWRRENPQVKPDLSGAYLNKIRLEKAHLEGVCLRKADLYKAVLYKAHLHKAVLEEAHLDRADLEEADLSKANLCKATLMKATLSDTNLIEVNLERANLIEANLLGADLSEANLYRANLSGANLSRTKLYKANLHEAVLDRANFFKANLYGANLSGADLSGAQLVEANLGETNLIGCRVYAVSAWNLELAGSKQLDLLITRPDEPRVTVDDLEVAQFIYLLTNNKKLSDIVDAVSRKIVLILGRFVEERKVILDAIRDQLRQFDYLPVLFDFEGPKRRDTTETVSTLAHISRFIIADITNPRAIPQELERIVPALPSVPIQPLIQSSIDEEYGMFSHLKRYPWVLETYGYDSLDDLLHSFVDKVINPVENKIKDSIPFNKNK